MLREGREVAVDVADADWKVNLRLAAMKYGYRVPLPGEQAHSVWADEPGSTENEDSQCATSIAVGCLRSAGGDCHYASRVLTMGARAAHESTHRAARKEQADGQHARLLGAQRALGRGSSALREPAAVGEALPGRGLRPRLQPGTRTHRRARVLSREARFVLGADQSRDDGDPLEQH